MLSDAEADALNVAVARAMGWKHRTDGSGGYWVLPDGGMDDAPPFGTDYEGKHYGDFHSLPDFCRDAHAIGWIVEWADSQEGVGLSTRRVSASLWGCTIRQGDIRAIEVGESRSEAVVRAIVDYACQKSEGSAE